MMKSLELFSGAGGLAMGLEKARFKHIALIDNNKHACESLRQNFSQNNVLLRDIKNVNFFEYSDVDIVSGGPPCQPFSLAGKHQANLDERDMFPYAIKAIEQISPKAFVFENVKGLLRKSFSDYFEYIILRLTYPNFQIQESQSWIHNLYSLRKINSQEYSGIKYDVSFKLLNAADFGVPQIRERVIIVGIRSDLQKKWVFPEATHSQERLLWDQNISGEYWRRHNIKKPKSITESAAVKFIFPPQEKAWKTVRDVLKNIPDPRYSHSIPDHIFKDGARAYPGHTGSELDCPAKTIKAGGHGVPGGENMIKFSDGNVRYFTVFEAKLLQTFPANFKVSGSWGESMRQIGNAVPVLLAEKIGKHLHDLIYEYQQNAKAI